MIADYHVLHACLLKIKLAHTGHLQFLCERLSEFYPVWPCSEDGLLGLLKTEGFGPHCKVPEIFKLLKEEGLRAAKQASTSS